MSIEICPACNNELSPGYHSWHLICNKCGYESSNFRQTINLNTTAHQLINENTREKGLQKLRLSNFNKLLISMMVS
jgi:DNA-directed RNA polymerase subunit M/transcription elongation factor TFIIS